MTSGRLQCLITELAYKDCAGRAVMLKMPFKGAKEDGFWCLVYEDLHKSGKDVVQNKCTDHAVAQSCCHSMLITRL